MKRARKERMKKQKEREREEQNGFLEFILFVVSKTINID